MAKVKDPDELPLVLLEEVALRTGSVPEVIARRLDGAVVADWAGRAAVPAAVARELVRRMETEAREHELAEAERVAAEKAAEAQRRQRYEDLLREELEVEARRVMQELRDSNVTFLGVTPPLSPADRARAAERARQRLEKEA
jgi:hypothetical protein